MIIPISIGFILIMLLFGAVVGKMMFENLVGPILIFIGIILVVWLGKKLISKWFEGVSDYNDYYEKDDEWNR